jgi:hypothetical protein
VFGGIVSKELSSEDGKRGIIELRVGVGGGVDESAGEGRERKSGR